MPYVYDMTQVEWPEDDEDFEPPPPRPEQFAYLAPPDFGGAREPVRFVDPSAGIAVQSNVSAPEKPSFLQRIVGSLGRGQSNPPPPIVDDYGREIMRVLLPALREIGIRRLYCRYDGGNDEGFSWLDHGATVTGEIFDFETLLEKLAANGVDEKVPRQPFVLHLSAGTSPSPADLLRDNLRYALSDVWATLLLGRGFGTGEYSMFGAFVVDLEQCMVVDDPDADPIVENIELLKQ